MIIFCLLFCGRVLNLLPAYRDVIVIILPYPIYVCRWLVDYCYFCFFFYIVRLIRWKMQIDNFGSQQSCTNSKESRIKISYNCWPFVCLACEIFIVQCSNASARKCSQNYSRCCCWCCIRATVALLPFNLSWTIFAVDVFAIVDHFTACPARNVLFNLNNGTHYIHFGRKI